MNEERETARVEAFSDGVFAIAITLLVLELHVPNGHVAADDVAEEELQAFSRERRAAAAFQGGATVLGAFLPVVAIGFYLAVSLVFIVEPLRRVRIRAGAPSSPDELAEPSAPSSGP